MASIVNIISACLCIIAFTASGVKAQTDRTAAFQSICEMNSAQINADCEAFAENLPSTVNATLIAEVTSGSICVVEEGEQEQETDLCEILESVCTQAVTCTGSADRTADFQTICTQFSTEINADCEEFAENLPSTVNATLVAEVTSGSICVVEEGEQEQETDLCEILEGVCIQAVTCTTARFRRSSSVSASASNETSSETD